MAAKKHSSRKRVTGPPSRITCYVSYSPHDGEEYADAIRNFLAEHGADVINTSSGAVFHTERELLDIVGRLVQAADMLIVIGTPTALCSEAVSFAVRLFEELLDHRRRSTRQRFDRRIIPIFFGDLTNFSRDVPFLHDINWMLEPDSAFAQGPSDQVKALLLRVIEEIGESAPLTPAIKSPRARAKEKRPLNEGKLILVGRGEVGKTSLVRRLVDNGFRGDESKTQGINIRQWSLRCPSGTFRLNIWDFGGQEIMHATHQFFLTERSLYLLVLNGCEGGEDVDAEYWLKHIETFGVDSPVIVVQNKIAQHPFELNYRGLQARYPQIRGFVKTDCKDATGIDSLRELIQQVVGEMPEVRMQFPADWFAVKERLESMESEYMGYDGFRELCSAEGIDDEADRDTLRWVLHCLGIALNYRDDSRLRETSVLKPEWVTQGIYRILNAKELASRQGELHLRDLLELLPTNRYPVDKHLFLLELMRKFSLCFPFPEEPDRYLVPELLGKEEPEETREFPPRDCLNFEYHYGVLPEGLIPRFIVRSHTLSRGQERWRSGVVLAHEDCKALVTAQAADRRVIVRVRGETRDRGDGSWRSFATTSIELTGNSKIVWRHSRRSR